MAIGPNSLVQFALPSYWDAGILEKFRLPNGTTYTQVVADISQGLSIANARILSDPIVASLISPPTTELVTEYGVGVTNGFEIHSEYTEPIAQRGATTGHMLPLDPFDRGLGWTWDFLRHARPAQIDNDIASAMQDLENLWQKAILTRLFKETYTAIGGAGRSMPLADGGTADASYIPLNRPDRASAFAYTHDHIAPLDGIIQANLETAVGNLWEHGYDAPYDLLVSAADIASWSATATVTGFVPTANALIRYGNSTDLAQVDPSYLGVIETPKGPVRVRATGRIPTTYWTVYKSFGPLDSRNPLAVRVGPEYGASAVLLPAMSTQGNPLQLARIFVEFGIGVRERVGAVVTKNTSSTYSDPTIT